jgi:Cu2+-exporting ATPase
LNLSSGKLVVRSHGASPHAILRRVRDLGYEAQPFEAEATLTAQEAEGRQLLHGIAASAFGTVFIMGLTDAIWYGGADLGEGLRTSFLWLAAVVAIPITLYAGQTFFRSALRALSHRQTNMDVPISAALLLSLCLSVYETARKGSHVYFDAAVMLTFLLLIGRYLDFRLRDRARSAARHLLALQSSLAQRLRPGGELETVAARDLQPGDRLMLASGDRLPVNGILEAAEGDATAVDLSLVTGESVPERAVVGTELQAGTIITGVPAILRATARVDNSLIADLARLLEAGQQSRSTYVRLADRAARAYVPLIGGLALLVFVVWLLMGGGLEAAATNAIAILIITCPCALGLAVPAVQIVATGRLFQSGVFVKSGDALERLADIDTAIFDKTGTLTDGTLVLSQAAGERAVMARAAMLARASHHPLARALSAAAGPGPVAPGVVEQPGAGVAATVEGETWRLGSASWCGVEGAAEQAGRLWFRAGETAPIALVFREALRPEVPELVQALRLRGIPVRMLTGDRDAQAATIAAAAGIADWQAGVSPTQKAEYIKNLRAQGRRVLMIGDGINDAGAMALADVSMAPGSAADVSQLASDMVLHGNSLTPVIEAVDVARQARRLVLQNFAMAALYNLTAIPLAAMGLVTPLIAAATMAGSSLIVTLNSLRLARRRSP